MRRIPLTKGKYAIVDDQDFDELSKYKWHLCAKVNHEYAYRRDYSVAHNKNGKGAMLSMHRQLLNFPPGVVDHKNMNGLDNRRENLRITSKSVNGLNCRKKSNSKNQYKGVCKYGTRWVAVIRINGIRFKSDSFALEIEAAKAYNMVCNLIIGDKK